jgi:hypothetical protein
MESQYHAELTRKPFTRSIFLKTALNFAERKISVLPLEGKTPLTPNGFKDASTDRSRIHAWWNRHPSANIGIATGSRSGLAVVDRDADNPEVSRIWDSLPPTVEVKTSRGRHRYYRIPEGVKVRSRVLTPGLDLKAEGGYVVAAGSLHPSGIRYQFVKETMEIGVATLPSGLVEADPKPQSSRRREGSTIGFDTGPIPEGTRNQTLTSIGGWLRATGKGQDEILSELLTINAVRCETPLPEAEVRQVARSVSRYEPGMMPSGPSPETVEAIDCIQRAMWDARWRNKSDRDTIIALLNLARRNSQLSISGDGVEVSISYRALALAAAVSKRTINNVVDRLIGAGWLRKGRKGQGTRSGSLVLLTRENLHHSNQVGGDKESKNVSGASFRAPRLRYSCTLPVMRQGKRVDTIVIRRLGKMAGAIIDVLTHNGSSVTIQEIADILQVCRLRDLTRDTGTMEGPITRLRKRGIVTVDRDTVALVDDWAEALDNERKHSGEKDAHNYWKARYKEESIAYQNREKVRAHRFTADDLKMAMARPISELERVPEPRTEVVQAVGLWLGKHPSDRRQPPSWLANTIWCHEYVMFKPTPLEVEVALAEIKRKTEVAA